MHHVLLAFTFLASLAAQPLLNEHLARAPVAIQLPLLVTALAMFLTDGAITLAWAAAAGFVSDCISPAPPGVDMLCMTLAVFTVRAVLGARPSGSGGMLLVGSSAVVFSAFVLSATARAVIHRVPADVATLLEHGLRTTAGTAGLIAAGWLAAKGGRRWNPLRFALRGAAR